MFPLKVLPLKVLAKYKVIKTKMSSFFFVIIYAKEDYLPNLYWPLSLTVGKALHTSSPQMRSHFCGVLQRN